MIYIFDCNDGGTVRYYGGFETTSIARLWLESHCPTKINGTYCDEGISRNNHQMHVLNSPLVGISKRAEVDIEHALTGN